MKRFVFLLPLLCCFSFLTLPAFAATSSGCPTTIKNFVVAPNVAASFSNSGNTTTYTFTSLTNEGPFTNGVPGLIKYCVYPDPATSEPTKHTVMAEGASGGLWLFKQDPKEFAFVRPGGNKTDILLNGTSTTMGTATFGTLPTDQTILLHIADPTMCKQVYPNSTAGTCFVKPSANFTSCAAGEGSTVAAYNAIPFGGANCAPGGESFEGDGVAEFGDEVTLAGTARTLVSLTVLFSNYACGDSGHWYDGQCVTSSNLQFTHNITAKIYDPSNLTTPLATVTTTQAIPFRPSADPVNCSGDPYGYASGSRWFNTQNTSALHPFGTCQYSIGTLLTFDFSSLSPTVTLPDTVIWTVAYNTSHSGYNPIAQPLGPGDACETSAGGCGYDSLNVGTKSYPKAPYAGTDVSEGEVWYSYYAGPGVPTNYPNPYGYGVLTPPAGIGSFTTTPQNPPETWGMGFRPLGEIITK